MITSPAAATIAQRAAATIAQQAAAMIAQQAGGNQAMKIALVWNHPQRLTDLSFRFGLYVQGFQALGHEATVVCPRACAAEVDYPLHLAERAETLEDETFWRHLGADVALAITYHRKAAMLAAIQRSGTRTLALSDSDGQVGLRAHPRITLARMWHYQPNWRRRLGCLKYFLGRYVFDARRGQEEDEEMLASTRHSDAVLFHSRPAIDHFRHFLRFHGEENLAQRCRSAPFAVPAAFSQYPLPDVKDDLVVAIGRWSDPQKDAPLLADALAIALAGRPRSRVEIFGHDAEPYFGELRRRHGTVRLRGPQPLEHIRETLSRARSVIFASRWETGPHVATEALSLGATLVGAPIPNLIGLTADDAGGDPHAFGRVATDRRPGSLAGALIEEMQAWDSERRRAQDIAAHWRPLLTPTSVCRQYLQALQSVVGPVEQAP